MSQVDQVIILAAGRGGQADGMAKCLIRHPRTGKTVIDHAITAFQGKKITVVVGFRAIQVMDHYPELNFAINENWVGTGNAASLACALSDEPTYVVQGDVFLSEDLVAELEVIEHDFALTSNRENRIPQAIHGVLDEKQNITSAYQGRIRDQANPELLGLFRVSTPEALDVWRRNSRNHSQMFASTTFPFSEFPIRAHDLSGHEYPEINTPSDYLRLIKESRDQ